MIYNQLRQYVNCMMDVEGNMFQISASNTQHQFQSMAGSLQGYKSKKQRVFGNVMGLL